MVEKLPRIAGEYELICGRMADASHPTGLRKIRIATAAFFFISGFGYSAWASRIPTVKEQLHLNDAQLGSILFVLPVGLMCTMPVTGQLLERYPGRVIMFFGSIFFNLMLCFAGFVSAPWQLVIIMFCFGSSRNLLNLSMNAQAVAVQSFYPTSIMTAFHGLWSLAGFAGALLGYLMVQYNVSIGWHLPAAGLSMTALTLLAYPRTLRQPPAKKSPRKIFALPDRFLVRFALIAFASMACENTMYDWSGIYLRTAVHSSAPTATAAFATYMVAMTSGRFAGDRLVNSIGNRQILHYSGVLIVSGLMLAVAFPNSVCVFIGFILTGFGVSCVVPLVFNLAARSREMSSHSALAAISTVGYLGFLMVPPLVGFIAHAAGIRISFAIMASLGLLIVWLVNKLPDDRGTAKTGLSTNDELDSDFA